MDPICFGKGSSTHLCACVQLFRSLTGLEGSDAPSIVAISITLDINVNLGGLIIALTRTNLQENENQDNEQQKRCTQMT